MKIKSKKPLAKKSQEELLTTLEKRFIKNPKRHKGLAWDKVAGALLKHPEKLWSLNEMEKTGGEPDIIGFDKKTSEFIFADCSAETPSGRRSCCFDAAARKARKENVPKNSAEEMAEAMGVTLMNEAEYRALQKLGEFDVKTSSWVATPPSIRTLGGSLFCDRRYGAIFTYHNGADSYYAARGFRASLRV